MENNLRNRRKSRPLLGIDISAEHVKLLEFAGRPDKIRVASYASERLPANAVSDHQIINVDAVGQALSRALKRSGTRNRNAAIGVSSAAVISKTITLPADMNEDEIEQQIMFEAPQHVPYPIENVSLDFQVLGPTAESPAHNDVLLVACRRDNVEMRTAVLEAAKLKPRLVDIEEYALRNACALLHRQTPDKGREKGIAIFEIGAQQTRLNLQRGRQTVYFRETAFGCRELALELADHYGLRDPEHLNAHLRNGHVRQADIAAPLGRFCDQLSQHIETTLQYCFSTQSTLDTVEQLLITGGCTRYPGFEQQMRIRLRLPVACADPLRDINSSGNARRNHVEHDGPSLMIAAGLAMRSVM